MSVDGEVRVPTPSPNGRLPKQSGFLAGSKALDTLDKLITCTESFFHPSNSGPWTALVCRTAQLILIVLTAQHLAHRLCPLLGVPFL